MINHINLISERKKNCKSSLRRHISGLVFAIIIMGSYLILNRMALANTKINSYKNFST